MTLTDHINATTDRVINDLCYQYQLIVQLERMRLLTVYFTCLMAMFSIQYEAPHWEDLECQVKAVMQVYLSTCR